MTTSVRNIAVNLVVWVVLPNLPLIVLSYFLWVPYRPASLFFLAFAFIVMSALPRLKLSDHARRLIPWVLCCCYVVLLTADLLQIMVKFFGLFITELIASLPMVMHLDITAHVPYMAFIFIVALSVAGFVSAARKVKPGKPVDALLTALVLLVLAAHDYLGFEARATPSIGADMPFTRAVQDGAIAPDALARADRNLVVVMVEALGQFKDPALAAALYGAFDDPALNRRFDIKRGSVPYYGSTTAAEMRELCLSKRSYLDVVDGDVDTAACLPNALARRGYDTVSYHGYVSDFFERAEWYPKVGFKRSNFADALIARAGDGVRLCGATFQGVCDRDIARWIRQDLEGAAEPTFAYWLTLNSHFPTRRSTVVAHAFPCAEHGLEADSQVCVMADYWMDVFNGAISIAQADTPRPTTVLIVGDHAPPILRRGERERFVADRVPYIALTPKALATAHMPPARE